MLGLSGSVAFFIVRSALNPLPAIDPSSVGGQIRMVNPRFTGRDADGTPYEITAQAAERPDAAADVTELTAPQLKFSDPDAPSAVVDATRGLFDQAAQTLDLLNGVSFRTDNGYEFESEHARAYVEDGRVVGDRMIMGAGPLGSIQAQGFEILDGGDKVIFSGDVKARLYPDRPETAPTSDVPGATLAPDALMPSSQAAPPVEEEGSDAAAPQAQISRQGGPIDITADAAEFVSPEDVVRWIGRVHVRQGDAELRSDRMDVFFAEDDEGGRSQEIVRIVADGSVIYTTPAQTARGDHGVYTVADEKIHLTGRVRLIEGADVLCVSELVIQPRLGRADAIGDGSGNDPECPGRARAVIRSSESP
jgi:lipopolysaccharide transport protein LptA